MNSNMKFFWLWTWPAIVFYSTFVSSYGNQYCHYIKSGQDMYCSHMNIGVLRNGEYPVNNSEIRKLRLQYTNLSILDHNVFHNLTNLTTLDISKNALQDLDYRLFSKSRQLNSLSIAHNNLIILDERLFVELNNLAYLDLAHNKMVHLPGPKIFKSQKKLVYLSIEGNKLQSIAVKTLAPLVELKVLKMLYNPINCNCQTWNIINWAKSKCLKMTATCNSPESVRGKSWREIAITKCKNPTSSIKTNCPMKSCAFIKRLGMLDCSDLKLASLTSYNITINKTKIRTLILFNNNLKVLKPDIFDTLPDLRSLNLRLNKIIHIEKSTFSNLTKLAYLDLSKNVLTRLETELFASQSMLVSLKLEDNYISSISLDTFIPLISMQRLNISGNPLTCSNNLKEVFDWFVKQNVLLEVTSIKPANYKDRPWKMLEEICDNSISVVNVMLSAICSFLLAFVPLSVVAGIYYYSWTRRQLQRALPVVKFSKNSNESSPTVEFGQNDVFEALKFKFHKTGDNQHQGASKSDGHETSRNNVKLQPTPRDVLATRIRSKFRRNNGSHQKYDYVEVKKSDRPDLNNVIYENVKEEPIYESVELDAIPSSRQEYLSVIPDLPTRPPNTGNINVETGLDTGVYIPPITK